MARYSISLPASRISHTPNSTAKTNTIAVTSIPKSFFHPVVLDVLRNHFSSFGEINRWVPLPGFGRIIIVFRYEDHAELAKQTCDPIVLQGSHDRSEVILRVYRADPNPLVTAGITSVPEDNYLRPPAVEKNFLISPPGSPPVGWEQIKEDPPNATPLADDLIEALRKLKVHERRSSFEVLLDPHEGSGVGVYVEDCDGGNEDEIEEEDWVYGQSAPARTRWQPTALPPFHPISA